MSMTERDAKFFDTVTVVRVNARAAWLDRHRLRPAIPAVAALTVFAVLVAFFNNVREWL